MQLNKNTHNYLNGRQTERGIELGGERGRVVARETDARETNKQVTRVSSSVSMKRQKR